MARKLKMTKKCIAARRRYRAKKAGAPTRRKRPTGTRKRRKKGSGLSWADLGAHVMKSQPKRSFGLGIKHRYVIQGKKRRPLKKRAKSTMRDYTRRISPGKYNLRTGKMGAGLRRKRRGRGRGRGRGPRGAGFWEDLGKSFEWVGNAALTALPFIAAVL